VTATGTVNELVVRNQLTGETLRYYGLKLDNGGSYALTSTALDMLSAGTRINATGTLSGNVFNLSLFSVAAAAQTADRATAQSERKKSVVGTVALYHKDYFEQGRGDYGLAVRDASDHGTQLNVAAIPDSLSVGMTISADGQIAADGTSLDVSAITILALPPVQQSGVAAAPVTSKVLVLPIKFSDSAATDPFTVAQIDTEFQTKVAPYYQEVSYGQQLLSITVANKNGAWLNAGVPASGQHRQSCRRGGHRGRLQHQQFSLPLLRYAAAIDDRLRLGGTRLHRLGQSLELRLQRTVGIRSRARP
jgi:hypothetical protein